MDTCVPGLRMSIEPTVQWRFQWIQCVRRYHESNSFPLISSLNLPQWGPKSAVIAKLKRPCAHNHPMNLPPGSLDYMRKPILPTRKTILPAWSQFFQQKTNSPGIKPILPAESQFSRQKQILPAESQFYRQKANSPDKSKFSRQKANSPGWKYCCRFVLVCFSSGIQSWLFIDNNLQNHPPFHS